MHRKIGKALNEKMPVVNNRFAKKMNDNKLSEITDFVHEWANPRGILILQASHYYDSSDKL